MSKLALIQIKGTIQYLDFEGGFWGIQSESNYLPINFPEQLKIKNAPVYCWVELLDVMTFQSWGTPCRIHGFRVDYEKV